MAPIISPAAFFKGTPPVNMIKPLYDCSLLKGGALVEVDLPTF